MEKIIFSNDNYQVTYEILDYNFPTVVTFNNWGDGYKPNVSKDFKRNFGEKGLIKRGLNYISVKTNKNDWYQSYGILDALDHINKLKLKKMISYGSSMGGFAAINYSNYLNVDYFIAYSPQASLESNFMTKIEDNRWGYESSKINFTHSNILNEKCKNSIGYLIYDGNHLEDNSHAKMILQKTNAINVNLPWSGHPSIWGIQGSSSAMEFLSFLINRKSLFDLDKTELDFYFNSIYYYFNDYTNYENEIVKWFDERENKIPWIFAKRICRTLNDKFVSYRYLELLKKVILSGHIDSNEKDVLERFIERNSENNG